jgi:hypothetical protein
VRENWHIAFVCSQENQTTEKSISCSFEYSRTTMRYLDQDLQGCDDGAPAGTAPRNLPYVSFSGRTTAAGVGVKTLSGP